MEKLPRKLNKKEAKITPAIFKWLEKNWNNSASVEIKIKGNKMYPHQKKAMEKVAKNVFSYKIPDMGRRTCFDGFLLKNADSLLITCQGYECEILNIRTNETRFFNCQKT